MSVPKVPFQADGLRCVDGIDAEPNFLPAAPRHHRAVDVDALVSFVQMKDDGQFRPCRHGLLCIDSASRGRKVPHDPPAASVLVQKEGRALDGNAAIGSETDALRCSQERQSTGSSGLRRYPIGMKEVRDHAPMAVNIANLSSPYPMRVIP